ncbi:MAG: BON domain-containing protein [Piscinibacter sp.]|uniref:BON domain-containing protein n=1 Tax=Piscinibacter sp. TaxID=1903157 RepID=UPI003D14046A
MKNSLQSLSARALFAAIAASTALVVLPGCAVSRGQSSVGEYIDDTTITTQVKARMVENKQVDAAAISVETLNGTVMLSGFAKSGTERDTAETIARNVKGVKSVKNEIVVRAS